MSNAWDGRPQDPQPRTGGRASWDPASATPPPAGDPASATPLPAGDGETRPSPIPPYVPQDETPRWGAPATGPQQPAYGAPPAPAAPHPRAQSLRTMGLVAMPLALFCNVIGLVLAIVVLVQVGGVTREIVAGQLRGLDEVKQARTFALIALVLGVLGGVGSLARSVMSWW